MKRILLSALAGALLLPVSRISAQQINEKVIVVNGGKFETAPPFADKVTVAAYNTISKTYHIFDSIASESTQGILVDGQNGFVLTQDSIVKYDFKTEKRLATAKYKGGSPHSSAIKGNTFLVGNWYGQVDSFLYGFDATTLAPTFAIQQVDKDVRGIAIVGDTAYLAQNIVGTIDGCAPYGCYDDSIGEITLVNLVSKTVIGTVSLGAQAAGITDLFVNGTTLVSVNPSANSVTEFNTTDRTFVTTFLTGTLGRGLALVGNNLYVMVNGSAAIYNLSTHSWGATNLTPTSNISRTVVDVNSGKFYQSTNAYSSAGKLYTSKAGILQDSLTVGISPEALGLYYSNNVAPIVMNDTVNIFYNQDTLIDVLANDFDTTFAPLSVTITSPPQLLGATAVVDVATQKILYTPAVGVVAIDVINYQACDAAGACAAGVLYLNVRGITNTGIENVEAVAIKCYPNPTENVLHLSADKVMDKIALTDLSGRVVEEKLVETSETEINIAALSSGIYLLSISVNGQWFHQRIVRK